MIMNYCRKFIKRWCKNCQTNLVTLQTHKKDDQRLSVIIVIIIHMPTSFWVIEAEVCKPTSIDFSAPFVIATPGCFWKYNREVFLARIRMILLPIRVGNCKRLKGITIKREALAVVLAVKEFHPYLYGITAPLPLTTSSWPPDNPQDIGGHLAR